MKNVTIYFAILACGLNEPALAYSSIVINTINTSPQCKRVYIDTTPSALSYVNETQCSTDKVPIGIWRSDIVRSVIGNQHEWIVDVYYIGSNDYLWGYSYYDVGVIHYGTRQPTVRTICAPITTRFENGPCVT